MSPDRGDADRLSEHLDAVVTGDATRSPSVDPALAAAVERFFAADDAPGPPPGLADRLWERLMDHPASVELVPRLPALPADRNGHAPPRPRPTALPRRGPSAIAYFATAALLALTLIGSFAAFRGSLPLVGPDQRAVIIPAIERTPEAALPRGVVADDLLLQATLEQMPPGRTRRMALSRFRLAPGAMQPVGSQADDGVGPNLFTVESGQITVEADAPVLLTRAAASPAAPRPVAAGTAVVLDVGDQLYAPSGVSFRRRNDGPTPATVLELAISTIGDAVRTRSLPPGVTGDLGLPYKLPSAFPAVPAAAAVHRLTLAPGGELAVRDLPGLELVYVEAGALDLVYAKAETLATPERAFTIRAGSGTETFGRTPELAVLANRGAEPLVILTASVVPADAGEAPPPTPLSDGWGSGDRPPE